MTEEELETTVVDWKAEHPGRVVDLIRHFDRFTGYYVPMQYTLPEPDNFGRTDFKLTACYTDEQVAEMTAAKFREDLDATLAECEADERGDEPGETVIVWMKPAEPDSADWWRE